MSCRETDVDRLRGRLLQAQRVIARPRPALIEFLRRRAGSVSASPRLVVRHIMSYGPDAEPMCQFIVDGDRQMRPFLAPLSQLSLSGDWRLNRKKR
jgi:hypothetical protein